MDQDKAQISKIKKKLKKNAKNEISSLKIENSAKTDEHQHFHQNFEKFSKTMDFCSVCFNKAENSENQDYNLITCEKCNLKVHSCCYGIPYPYDFDTFTCDKCNFLPQKGSKVCKICLNDGELLKKVHVLKNKKKHYEY